MEQKVIMAYNFGNLTPETLDAIMEPYKGTDCDSGGSNDLTSKDGLRVEHIICRVMKPKETKSVEEHPKFYDLSKTIFLKSRSNDRLFLSFYLFFISIL